MTLTLSDSAGARRLPVAGGFLRLSSHTRQVLLAAVVGLVVGTLVVLPWIREGYLILLDWISGPEQAITAGLYGLNGDQVDGLPWRLGVQIIRDIIGPQATAWVLILVFFPLAGAGMAHLVRGTSPQTLVAALAITCNPLVITRVAAGHVPYLIGIACLPWLLASALNARRRDRWFSARTAGWYAVGLAITPHMAWLGGVTLLLVALLPRPTGRSLVRLLLTVIAAASVYAYGIAIWLTGVRVPTVGNADLTEYATRPDDSGLLLTILSLRGFWRERTIDVGSSLGYWWIPITLAVVALAVIGLGGYAYDRAARGPVLFGMLVFGVIASAGTQGPFGWLYLWAFDHVPLFEVMREPLKWLPLVLIPLAAGLARAVPALTDFFVDKFGSARSNPTASEAGTNKHSVAVAVATIICALPALACLPTLTFGLGGEVKTSEYPSGWYAANELMGSGDGSILFVPWHGYQAFDFTDGRAVATPARAFFTRPVISSAAVELGDIQTDSASARGRFLDEVLAIGRKQSNLGVLLAPMGIEYVAVATDTSIPENYTWLAAQGGMTQVLKTESMTVYRVESTATGRVVGARQAKVKELVAAADARQVGTEAVLPDGPTAPPVPSADFGGLMRVSPTEWSLAAGKPGWVVVPEDWNPGWRLNDQQGVPTTQGLVAFRTDGSAATITYRPWQFIKPAIIVSLLALLVLVVIGFVDKRRSIVDRRSRSRATDEP